MFPHISIPHCCNNARIVPHDRKHDERESKTGIHFDTRPHWISSQFTRLGSAQLPPGWQDRKDPILNSRTSATGVISPSVISAPTGIANIDRRSRQMYCSSLQSQQLQVVHPHVLLGASWNRGIRFIARWLVPARSMLVLIISRTLATAREATTPPSATIPAAIK
jgi:hypothetical protein